MRRIALTTGDLDGVGCEISARALNEIHLRQDQLVTVFLHPEQIEDFEKSLKRKAHITDDPAELFREKAHGVQLFASPQAPARWVEMAAELCLHKKFNALVTGPLSKPGIREAGLKDLGHTDILARLSGHRELFMSFWGRHFNVVLVTGHIPLNQVPRQFTKDRLLSAAQLTRKFMKNLGRPMKPIAWLGINPHASDSGLIGKQDLKLRQQLQSTRFLKGPLVPDSAFATEDLNRYGAFLCAYHDQGLIPFKLAHGFDEGVHVTLGLPFLRTSVDHGPAKDLVGTGKARHGSMKAALEMALAFRA